MNQIIFNNRWWLITAAWVYTLTFLFDNYWSRYSDMKAISNTFEQRIKGEQDHFREFYSDTESLAKLSNFQIEGAEKKFTDDKESFYYIYTDQEDRLKLTYWSKASVIPPETDIPYKDTIQLVTYPNGIFLKSVHNIPSKKWIVVQLLPLKWQYYIDNEYLAESYPGGAGLEKFVNLHQAPTDYPVRLPGGTAAFYLQRKGEQVVHLFNWPSFIIGILTAFFIIVFVQRLANAWVTQRRFLQALLVIIASAFALRLSIFYLHFPINLTQLVFFKKAAGNTPIFLSLGNRLLDLLIFVWILYFLRKHQSQWIPRFKNLPLKWQKVIAVSAVVLLVSFTLAIAHAIRQLILNPSISFDVSDFFSLGWSTFFAIGCLYFTAIIHYNVLHICNRIFVTLWPYYKTQKFLLISVCGLISLTVLLPWLKTTLLLIVLGWILLSVLLEDLIPQRFLEKIAPSTNLLVWMIWYSLSSTLLVVSQNTEKELESRKQVAKNIGIQKDPRIENSLHTALVSDEIAGIPARIGMFENRRYYNTFFDTLQKNYFLGTLGSYETAFYLFNEAGNPISNNDSASFSHLNSITNHDAAVTQYPGVYYFQSRYEKFSYIIRQTLIDPGNGVKGYLFILSTPISTKRDALVPELLKSREERERDLTFNYSYAVYHKRKLVMSKRDYPFNTDLTPTELPKTETDYKKVNGVNQLWYNAGNEKTVLVVRSGSLLSDGITLFAYIFGTFIILTFLQNLLNNLVKSREGLKLNIFNISRLSIKGQIQSTILTVSFVSFLVIGIVTITFFIYRFRQNNTNRLVKVISQVNSDIQDNIQLNEFLKTGLSVPDSATNTAVVPFIKKTAEFHSVDINILNRAGDVVVASQPLLFERGIISRKMDDKAFFTLAVRKKVQFLQNEKIGTLQYLSIYAPIRTENGETIGYLNIPHFSAENDLNQEISNFLVVLINFNAFIFLLSGIIAFFITNSITSSFSLIGEKMKAVGFGNTNEPIVWKRNDEIGTLVIQYNKMIEQLYESARKLAKSERESAWREMAKQVAHEIKNPLTPMKLSLQYLQRAIDSDSPNALELARQVSANLVEQINHLSKIASDFSQFAQIGLARMEVFDLHEVVQQVVMLYEKNRHAFIRWNIIGKPIYIEADKTQINRLFTNLLQNACEASADNSTIDITIGEETHDEFITISLADKGSGIHKDLHGQIFTPNFTTKTSGTGLGLAICRDIVEKAHGEIWFETNYGVGTVFFIKLPISEKGI